MAKLHATQLTERELHVIARRAYNGEAPLERLFNNATFGPGHDPNGTPWADWPQHARDAWDKTVWYYRVMKDTGVDPDEPTPRGGPSLAETWRAIIEAAPNGGPWYELPGVTWPKLSPLLGIGARSVHYYMVRVHGWEFAGRGSSRRIELAPCIVCGSPTDVGAIRDRTCPSCFDQTPHHSPR